MEKVYGSKPPLNMEILNLVNGKFPYIFISTERENVYDIYKDLIFLIITTLKLL